MLTTPLGDKQENNSSTLPAAADLRLMRQHSSDPLLTTILMWELCVQNLAYFIYRLLSEDLFRGQPFLLVVYYSLHRYILL